MDPLLNKIISLQRQGIDQDDSVDTRKKISWLSICWRAYKIIFWFLDIAFDTLLIINFFLSGHYRYAAITISLVLLTNVLAGSYLAITIDLMKFGRMSILRPSTYRVLRFLLMLFGPGVRKVEAVYFAIKRNRAADRKDEDAFAENNRKLKEADFECRITDLVECFCEKAPQMLLSLHFIFQGSEYWQVRKEVTNDPTMVFSMAKMCCLMFWEVGYRVHCLSSHPLWPLAMVLKDSVQISFTLFSHHKNVLIKALSLSRPTAEFVGRIIYLFWRFFEITSRVQILVLLLLLGRYYLLPVILVHSITFGLFLRFYRFGGYYGQLVPRLEGVPIVLYVLTFRYICCAAMSFFTFFIPFTLPSKREYIVYYTVVFMENTALVVSAVFLQIVDWPTLVTHCITYFSSLALMVLYCYSFMKWEDVSYMSEESDWHLFYSKLIENYCASCVNSFRLTLLNMKNIVASSADSFEMFLNIMKVCTSFIKVASERVQDRLLVRSRRDVGLFKRILEDMNNLSEKPFVRIRSILKNSQRALDTSNWSMAEEVVQNIRAKVAILDTSTRTRFDAEVVLKLYLETLCNIEKDVKEFEESVRKTRGNVRSLANSFNNELNVDGTVKSFSSDLQAKLDNLWTSDRVSSTTLQIESVQHSSSKVKEAAESYRGALISVDEKVHKAFLELIELMDNAEKQVVHILRESQVEESNGKVA